MFTQANYNYLIYNNIIFTIRIPAESLVFKDRVTADGCNPICFVYKHIHINHLWCPTERLAILHDMVNLFTHNG